MAGTYPAIEEKRRDAAHSKRWRAVRSDWKQLFASGNGNGEARERRAPLKPRARGVMSASFPTGDISWKARSDQPWALMRNLQKLFLGGFGRTFLPLPN